jgi:hypothetical protein
VDIEDEIVCVDCVDVIEFDIGRVESDKGGVYLITNYILDQNKRYQQHHNKHLYCILLQRIFCLLMILMQDENEVEREVESEPSVT